MVCAISSAWRWVLPLTALVGWSLGFALSGWSQLKSWSQLCYTLAKQIKNNKKQFTLYFSIRVCKDQESMCLAPAVGALQLSIGQGWACGLPGATVVLAPCLLGQLLPGVGLAALPHPICVSVLGLWARSAGTNVHGWGRAENSNEVPSQSLRFLQEGISPLKEGSGRVCTQSSESPLRIGLKKKKINQTKHSSVLLYGRIFLQSNLCTHLLLKDKSCKFYFFFRQGWLPQYFKMVRSARLLLYWRFQM